MAKEFKDFQDALDKRLQDLAAKMDGASKDAVLVQAITQRYSKDRPIEVVTDVAGNGTNQLTTPVGGNGELWEENFSSILQMEYPIGDIPPAMIEDGAFTMYRTPSGLKILMFELTPSAAEFVRVTWTARHSQDGSTVPEPDFEATCDFATSIALEQIAATYVQTSDPTIAADVVNYRTKSQECISLAKSFRKRYFDHLGIPESGDGGASGQGPAYSHGDIDLNMGYGGDRITHGGKTR